MTIKTTLGLLISLLALQTTASAQLPDDAPIALKNVETGLYLDIRGGHIRPGTRLWQWPENETNAQYFKPARRKNSDAYLLQANRFYENKAQLITASEFPQDVLVQPGQPAPERFRVTIESEIEPPSNDGLQHAYQGILNPKPKFQWWYFEAVPNTRNQYVIRSGRFNDNRVLTADARPVKGSPILLRPYAQSDTQHWVVERLTVEAPSSVVLEDFHYWRSKRLLGDIGWTANSERVDYFQVVASNDSLGTLRSSPISSNAREWEMEFDVESEAEGKEWCFRVIAVDERNGPNISEASPEVCQVAQRKQAQVIKYSKLVVENCHPSGRPVRIWLAETGVTGWQDKGLLSHQSGPGGCPTTGSAVVIDFTAGKSYEMIAVDSGCGNNPPSNVNSSCRFLSTTVLQGDPNGATCTMRIGVGGC